jgi:uncharacterized protein (DUF488 family)
MFWREKVLLHLLRNTPARSATKIQVLKWLFLLREEENINEFGSFYDFLPYKFGPFSFTVYRDIEELENFGYINTDPNSIYLIENRNLFNEFVLSDDVKISIGRILKQFGLITQQQLIEYVYKKYPWYAAKSELIKIKRNENSKSAQIAIYLIGYEGMSIDYILNLLLRCGIQSIIDIRSNPVSHKYGFSKPPLMKKCKDVGINYFHFPELGIPSTIRKEMSLKTDLWHDYTTNILKDTTESVKRVTKICKTNPSVFLCFEKEPDDCHRYLLAKEIKNKTELDILSYNQRRSKWEKL